MCPSVSVGTIRGLTEGIVTSASIQTCCPAFDQFAAFAVTNPQYDYGVHLTITCDLPEQPWGPLIGEAAPSLVGEDGNFPWWPAKTVELAEVEAELRAQIDLALSRGIRITHLDNHMFSLDRSVDLFRLHVQLGIDCALPIRFTRNLPSWLSGRDADLSAIYAQLAGQLIAQELPLLEHVESANYSVMPDLKRAYFLDQLARLPIGVSEIIVHCAVTGRQINPPDLEKRNADLDFFTSLEGVEHLRRNHIQPITWDQI